MPGHIPIYLFADGYFWIFLLVNCFGLLYITYLTANLLIRKSRMKLPTQFLPLGVAAALLLALAYQFFHHIEHVAQIHQFSFLGKSAKESMGILWFFDIEWNHFVFNAGYFGLLLFAAASVWRWQKKMGLRAFVSPIVLVLLFATVWEGWHLVEHTVKITQHVVVGCKPCKGIADRALGIKLPILHYWYNFVALFLTEVAFFGLDVPQRTVSWLKTRRLRRISAQLRTT